MSETIRAGYPLAREAISWGSRSATTFAAGSGQEPPTAQFYAADDETAGATVAELIRTADLHEVALGTALTEQEARKLI